MSIFTQYVNRSSKIDKDTMVGSGNCDQCPDYIEHGKMYYFINPEESIFCHPSCLELYFVLKDLQKG
jgi:hypothetical protein